MRHRLAGSVWSWLLCRVDRLLPKAGRCWDGADLGKDFGNSWPILKDGRQKSRMLPIKGPLHRSPDWERYPTGARSWWISRSPAVKKTKQTVTPFYESVRAARPGERGRVGVFKLRFHQDAGPLADGDCQRKQLCQFGKPWRKIAKCGKYRKGWATSAMSTFFPEIIELCQELSSDMQVFELKCSIICFCSQPSQDTWHSTLRGYMTLSHQSRSRAFAAMVKRRKRKSDARWLWTRDRFRGWTIRGQRNCQFSTLEIWMWHHQSGKTNQNDTTFNQKIASNISKSH